MIYETYNYIDSFLIQNFVDFEKNIFQFGNFGQDVKILQFSYNFCPLIVIIFWTN